MSAVNLSITNKGLTYTRKTEEDIIRLYGSLSETVGSYTIASIQKYQDQPICLPLMMLFEDRTSIYD